MARDMINTFYLRTYISYVRLHECTRSINMTAVLTQTTIPTRYVWLSSGIEMDILCHTLCTNAVIFHRFRPNRNLAPRLVLRVFNTQTSERNTVESTTTATDKLHTISDRHMRLLFVRHVCVFVHARIRSNLECDFSASCVSFFSVRRMCVRVCVDRTL